MRNFFILLVLIGCGLEPLAPLPPLGCDEMKPICICDEKDNCNWQWICEEKDGV